MWAVLLRSLVRCCCCCFRLPIRSLRDLSTRHHWSLGLYHGRTRILLFCLCVLLCVCFCLSLSLAPSFIAPVLDLAFSCTKPTTNSNSKKTKLCKPSIPDRQPEDLQPRTKPLTQNSLARTNTNANIFRIRTLAYRICTCISSHPTLWTPDSLAFPSLLLSHGRKLVYIWHTDTGLLASHSHTSDS